MPRNQHDYFLQIALSVAQRSTCPRAHVGAIIVNEGRIVSSGYNGAPSKMPHCEEIGCITDPDGRCLRVVHAEANALIRCPNAAGMMMYVTHLPCLRCAQLIINAGISTVCYMYPYNEPLLSLFDVKSIESFLVMADVDIIRPVVMPDNSQRELFYDQPTSELNAVPKDPHN